MKRFISYVLIVVMLLFTSCRVWEVRDDCPCWLMFFFGGYPERVSSVEVMGWRDGVPVFDRTLALDQDLRVWETEVEKGTLRTTVMCGVRSSVREDRRVIIPEGQQADSLFMHVAAVDCSGEFASDSVTLHKEWVTMSLKINIGDRTKVDEEPNDNVRIVVTGNVCGVDLIEDIPVNGSFVYEPAGSVDGVFTFRVPRHMQSDELDISVYRGNVMVDSISMMSLLQDGGFDWSEDSLPDVDVAVSLITKEALITVIPWEDLGHDNIIL